MFDSLSFPLKSLELVRFTRFAKKGGIGNAIALVDHESSGEEDLMFLEGDSIVILLDLSHGRYLGYSEGVIGSISGLDIQINGKLKRPVVTQRVPVPIEKESIVKDTIVTQKDLSNSSSPQPPPVEFTSPAHSIAPSFAFSPSASTQSPRTPIEEEGPFKFDTISPTPNLPTSLSHSASTESSLSDFPLPVLQPLELNRLPSPSLHLNLDSNSVIAVSNMQSAWSGFSSLAPSPSVENTEEFIYDSYYRSSRGSSLAPSGSIVSLASLAPTKASSDGESRNFASEIRGRMAASGSSSINKEMVQEAAIPRTTSVADSLVERIQQNFHRSSPTSSIGHENLYDDSPSQPDLSPLLEGTEEEFETPTMNQNQELPPILSRSNSSITSTTPSAFKLPEGTLHQRRRASTVGERTFVLPPRSPSIFIEHLPPSRPGSASSSLAMSPHSLMSHSISSLSHQSIAAVAVTKLDSIPPSLISPESTQPLPSPSPEPIQLRKYPSDIPPSTPTAARQEILEPFESGWSTPPPDENTRSVWSPKSPTNKMTFFRFGGKKEKSLKSKKSKKDLLSLDFQMDTHVEIEEESRKSGSIRGRSLSYGKREDLIPPRNQFGSSDRFSTTSLEDLRERDDANEKNGLTLRNQKSMIDLGSEKESKKKKSGFRKVFGFGK